MTDITLKINGETRSTSVPPANAYPSTAAITGL